MELMPADADQTARCKKIVMDEKAIDELLVDLYIQAQARQPERIVLDLDATDDRFHGHQEGRFSHGYHGDYCYLPLYIIGDHLVYARRRPSNLDASAGVLEEVERIVGRLRRLWPKVKIILRADDSHTTASTARFSPPPRRILPKTHFTTTDWNASSVLMRNSG